MLMVLNKCSCNRVQSQTFGDNSILHLHSYNDNDDNQHYFANDDVNERIRSAFDVHQVENTLYAVLGKRSDSLRKLDQKIQRINNNFKFVENTCQNTHANVKWDKYNGHCYHYGTDIIDWYTAKRYCQKIGGYLVKIDNTEENRRIHSIIRKTGRNHWIGLTDFKEGEFRWTYDQSVASSIPWYPGTGKHNTNKNCVDIGDFSGKWGDRTCSIQLAYICERNFCN
ncbi:CD206 [Mytilus edulis]|uniref:MRC n=1 Tax=Mytilus edulis TaxID=6550 RepID=A0A8S3PV85_MYTED|nr:CD206 [Mytilus edulis]